MKESAKGVKPGSLWKEVKLSRFLLLTSVKHLFVSQVKRGLDKDPRYDAVGSSSLREELFNTYLKTLSNSTVTTTTETEDTLKNKSEAAKQDKAQRKERAVREREEKVRREREKLDRDKERSKNALSREEGEREFMCADFH